MANNSDKKTMAELVKEALSKPIVMAEQFKHPKISYSDISESDPLAKLYKNTFDFDPSAPADDSLKLEAFNKIKSRSKKLLAIPRMLPAKEFLESVLTIDDMMTMTDSIANKVNKLYSLAVKECNELKDDEDKGEDGKVNPEPETVKVKEEEDEKDPKDTSDKADDKDADKDGEETDDPDKKKDPNAGTKADYTELINKTLAQLKLKSLNKASPKQKRLFWTIIEKEWKLNGMQGPFPFMFLTDKEQEAIENGRVKAVGEDLDHRNAAAMKINQQRRDNESPEDNSDERETEQNKKDTAEAINKLQEFIYDLNEEYSWGLIPSRKDKLLDDGANWTKEELARLCDLVTGKIEDAFSTDS